MKTASFSHCVVVACAIGLCLTGCKLLKPTANVPRSFVLTPIPSHPESLQPGVTNVVIGIRPVKMAGYLSTKGFAMRRGSNEIVYLEQVQWAERLDNALQRVIASNLGTLVPTDQVRLSLWGAESVSFQIDVNVERFDVDSQGQATLTAWWRVLASTGELIDSGRFVGERKGPSPEKSTEGAAASLSSLVGDFSKNLAEVIKHAPKQRTE
jgi:uncharacterized lipoprotein YmbA